MQFENIKIKKVNLSGRELTVEYDEINVPDNSEGLVVTNSVKKCGKGKKQDKKVA